MTTKSRSIKGKILLFSAIIPILITIIFSAVLFYSQRNTLIDSTEYLLASNADSITDEISLELSESFQLLRNLSVNPYVISVLSQMPQVPAGLDNDDYISLKDAPEMKNLMDRVSQGTNAELVFAAGLDSTGIILARDIQIAEGFDVRKRDYYSGALENPGEIFISQPRVSAEKTAEPKIVITAALAVKDDSGTPVGVVCLNYSFDPIVAIIRGLMERYQIAISLYDRTNSYLLWAFRDEGDYFYNPDDINTVESELISLGYKDDALNTLLNDISQKHKVAFRGDTFMGEALMEADRVGSTRWGVIIARPLDQVEQEITGTIAPVLLIFLISFTLLQIFVFYVYTRLIIRPLTGIGTKLQDLAAADADLTVSIPVTNNNEIGRVGLSFNSFIEKLHTLMSDVKQVIDETDSVRHEVSSSTEETSSSIEQISANLESIRKQINGLDVNISDNVSAIEEMTQNITAMDEQIIDQSSMVEESNAAITEMIASLNNVNGVAQNKRETTQILSRVAEEGKNNITSTAEAFKTVVGHINEIQNMASTISAIASQTNLLSMNAAIEAAHAGDAGKGFAVVAEEIRKLADSAGTSSKQISKLIKDVTNSVNETDNNMGVTAQAFEKISKEVGDTINAFSEIEQSVAELNIGGQQILDSTNQINDVTVSIRSGSTELNAGIKMMLSNSTQMREVSDMVTTGMSESVEGTREITKSMQLMVTLSQQLSKIVEQLKQNFGQFKTK